MRINYKTCSLVCLDQNHCYLMVHEKVKRKWFVFPMELLNVIAGNWGNGISSAM